MAANRVGCRGGLVDVLALPKIGSELYDAKIEAERHCLAHTGPLGEHVTEIDSMNSLHYLPCSALILRGQNATDRTDVRLHLDSPMRLMQSFRWPPSNSNLRPHSSPYDWLAFL